MPEVDGTGRHYAERTRGGWLVSRGVERHVFPGRRGKLVLAAVLLVALALLVYWRS